MCELGSEFFYIFSLRLAKSTDLNAAFVLKWEVCLRKAFVSESVVSSENVLRVQALLYCLQHFQTGRGKGMCDEVLLELSHAMVVTDAAAMGQDY